MTARDAYDYMIQEGGLRIERNDLAGIDEVFDRKNARAEDLLEHLHKIGRISMRIAAKWARRLELEDVVRFLLKKGVIQFAEACYFFQAEPDSSVTDLGNFLYHLHTNDDSFDASLFKLLQEGRAAAAGKTTEAVAREQKNRGREKTRTGAKDNSAKRAS